MYCTKCGTSRPAGTSNCPNCGAAPQSLAQAQPVQNYLIPSIIVTVCCCMPAGVVAIIYAAQVNTKLAAGDVAGAQQSSLLAKRWTWIGFGVGAAAGVLYAIVAFLGALGGSP